MNKIITYIFMLFAFGISSFSIASEENIVIKSVTKNCSQLLNINILDYSLCNSWELSEGDIVTILKNKEKINIANPIRDMTLTDMNIYYEGEIVLDGEPYNLDIYATSWLSLLNQKNDEIKYYSCQNTSCSEFFLGNYISEELLSKVDEKDVVSFEEKLIEKFNNNRSKVKQPLKIKQLKLSDKWFGTYSVIPNYTLVLSKGKCTITNTTNAKRSSCYAFEAEETLYVYNDLTTLNGYIDIKYQENNIRFIDGDFILKIDKAGNLNIVNKLESVK
ncbi:hypothetical protein [Entomomonas asaccharolytica]|uniref:Uncharacterized protein n=1 Tax=Entomomonas asaccharolytica TaxID=2785331 RepID=A0A974RXE9_9GAMM|nr:hypothetical protein [Entomomonas asaccharolytica]QQP84784.1 hypothetical protein JHT90_10265 [Entomomonas asaccharolytica]